LFQQVADRNPESTQAADAIHFAGEAALLKGDLNEAAALVERFEKDYARTAYRMQNRLLAGRLLEARAEALPADQSDQRDRLQQEARATYTDVLETTTVEATQSKARFALARLHERRNEPARAVEAIAPVLDGIRDQGAESPYLGALVIAARARLALEEPA